MSRKPQETVTGSENMSLPASEEHPRRWEAISGSTYGWGGVEGWGYVENPPFQFPWYLLVPEKLTALSNPSWAPGRSELVLRKDRSQVRPGGARESPELREAAWTVVS